MKQLDLIKNTIKHYGGDHMTTRKGRQGGRPLATKQSMHLVLRSSQAKGEWSMREHHGKIKAICNKFALKCGVRLLSVANVGNHLHFHIQLGNRFTYKPFIRAITSAIAMAVTGVNRWNKQEGKLKFWDRRPFTRVIIGWRAVLNLRDYLLMNKIEGHGYDRSDARILVRTYRQARGSG